MTIKEAQTFVSRLLDGNKAHIQVENNSEQLIPDIRRYIEYQDMSDDAMAAMRRYKLGFLRQPKTKVPDREVLFISMESGISEPHLYALDDRISEIFPEKWDEEVVSKIIDDIKTHKLTLVLVV